MAWIESHQSLSKHRKTLLVMDLLKVDRFKSIGHLHQLWWWALDNVDKHGCLGHMSDSLIATGAEWRGDPSRFVNALVEARFIDMGEDGQRYLHNWYKYAGKLMEKREANAERMRNARAGDGPTASDALNDTRATHVQNTCSACAGATVPNRTQPYPTVPSEPESPVQPVEAAPPIPPKLPDADAPASQGKGKKVKSERADKPKGVNLAPLFEAFDAAGAERPIVESVKEKAAAQFLVRYFPTELSAIPECLSDIASGRYGGDYERRKLSLALLASDNFFQNWLRWRDEGKPPERRGGSNGTGATNTGGAVRGVGQRAGADGPRDSGRGGTWHEQPASW